MFKNGHLRLLMTLIGFQRLLSTEEDDIDASWIIPSTLSSAQLAQANDLIKATEFSPPVFEDGVLAEDHIRRKSAARPSKPREAFDDEDENALTDDDEELFPAGGPTARKPSEALAALKKSRRKRRASGSDGEEDDEAAEQRRKEREEQRAIKEREKQRKIKSALYVNDSDEESDAERDQEFFSREEKLRQKQKIAALKELLGEAKKNKEKVEGTKKRSATVLDGDTDEDDDMPFAGTADDGSSPETTEDADEDVLRNSENGDAETPASSPHFRSSQTKRRRISNGSDSEEDEEEQSHALSPPNGKDLGMMDVPEAHVNEDDDEDDVPVARPARRRIVSGFVDSSDEE